MGGKTKISWSDATLNVVSGCTPVSAGCQNCYASRYAKRGIGDFVKGFRDPNDNKLYRVKIPFSEVRTHPDRLEIPLHWRKPRKVFLCSMGDLFHDSVPDEFIEDVFATMANTNHVYQILTKRPKRMLEWMRGEWRDTMIEGRAQKQWHERTGEDPSLWLSVHLPLPNVWLGVTAENQAAADERIPLLLQTPAAVRFVSCEPLLGPVDIRKYLPSENWCFCGYVGNETGADFCVSCENEFGDGDSCQSCGCEEYESSCPKCGRTDSFGCWDSGPIEQRPKTLDWAIVGGETGTGARPMQIEWARSIVQQCKAAGVAVHMKQMGSNCAFRDDSPAVGPEFYPTDTEKQLEVAADALGEELKHWFKFSGKGANMDEWPEDLRVREFPEGA